MKDLTRKPAVFIGSSKEGLIVARALEEVLEFDTRVNVWTSNLFLPGGTTIESLFEQLSNSDYAIFVLTADDLIDTRGRQWAGPRDNVVFELGLFMGRLGRDRSLLLYERDIDLKIPTDLAGLTAITYSGERFRENSAAALGPAANKLRRLVSAPRRSEVDFIKSYIGFIGPDTRLDDSYSQILARHYNTLCAEVAGLEQRADWARLLEVKQRLREYFEYSGRYAEGVDFGRRYVKALESLGNQKEALWTRVKHIGYLQVLSGDHEAGRREISRVLTNIEAVERSDDEYNELLFYCYRYLSISFLRDQDSGSMEEATRYLELASGIAAKYDIKSEKGRDLVSRLESNRGNVALAAGDVISALNHYRRSLEMFVQLSDKEHEGIAHLKIAEASVADPGLASEITTARHLDAAESIFMRLGWKEGHARVWEQRSHRAIALSKSNTAAGHHASLLDEALIDARNAYSLYESIQNSRGIGRAESLIKQIEDERRGRK